MARDTAQSKTQIPFETRRRRRRIVAISALTVSLVVLALSLVQMAGLTFGGGDGSALAQDVVRPNNAVTNASPGGARDATGGQVPGNVLGTASDSSQWRGVRSGECYTVSIPNKTAGCLVQSEGAAWRALRNGPLSAYYLYGLVGMLALLVVFFVIKGRIRLEQGFAGRTIERFNDLERFGHWLLAGSFIVLALTGLNVVYGRYVLLPVLGPEAFSALTVGGKWLHNNIAWAFMAGLALVFFMWVLRNLPARGDITWLVKGGGIIGNAHVDAHKFNAGQKLIFWSTIILGLSLSLSGIALLFPGETAMMSKTFAILNGFGFNFDTNLTPTQEMQLQVTWHGIVAVVMIAIILAHIYIGTLGMEGAFAAMGSGQVDENWAKEHHGLWVEEERSKGSGAATPAE